MRCYLCGGAKFIRISKGVRDNPDVNVLKCLDCSLVFLESFEHISPEFYRESGMHDDPNQSVDAWIRDTRIDDLRRLKQLTPLIGNKRVLDFGCGNGGFLSHAKNIAQSVMGVELEKRIQNYWDGEIEIRDSLDQVKDDSVDLITAFHVVEHLPDPLQILTELKKKLAVNGRIIIEVPNSEDALVSVYQSDAFKQFTYWSKHLYLFNSNTLKSLIAKAGFESVQISHYQRYSLSNHLYWLSKGLPGGHMQFSFLDTEELNLAYANSLARLGVTDSIVAYVR